MKYVLDFEKPIADLEQKLEEMKSLSGQINIDKEVKVIEKKILALRKDIYGNLTNWQKVQLSRHPERPYTLDYIYEICGNFEELHGDRHFGDDKAIVGGFCTIDNFSVMLIGHQKGRDTKSNIYRNFGMANPEGYRKALRLMKLAEKFNKPIITLIDTPGAFPGLEAEERGQAEAIARNLYEMFKLNVPVISVVIGEGASGGALGIGVCDRLLMMENCWFSVISPESCSSILWRSWDYKEQAAEALKLTADDLLKQGIIDRIVPEPLGGAHVDLKEAASILKNVLIEELTSLTKMKIERIKNLREKKYASLGAF